MSLISIVIPCYNQGHFLKDALDSVLAQTYKDIEVIVINDGSTDSTDQVMREFREEPRIRYIYQENKGLPATRNRGLQESRGTYVNFLDADDWFAADKLSRQVALLEEDQEAAFVYCDIEQIFSESAEGLPVSVSAARRQLEGDIFASLLMGGYFPPHTALIRRSVLDKVGPFDETLGGYADWELWLRISGNGFKARYIDKKLAFYRIHDSNMSKQYTQMRLSHALVLPKITQQFSEKVARSLDEIIRSMRDLDSANAWLNGEYSRLLKTIELQDSVIKDLKEWIEELQFAKGWLEEQRTNWQSEAENYQAVYYQVKQGTEQLQDAHDRLLQLYNEGLQALDRERMEWQQELESAKDSERILQQEYARLNESYHRQPGPLLRKYIQGFLRRLKYALQR